jgi:hypothetical protein
MPIEVKRTVLSSVHEMHGAKWLTNTSIFFEMDTKLAYDWLTIVHIVIFQKRDLQGTTYRIDFVMILQYEYD